MRISNKWIFFFREYLTGRGLKDETIVRNTSEVNRFFKYLESKGFEDIKDVGSKEIDEYFMYLKSTALSNSTKLKAYTSVKELFTALDKYEKILSNPFEKVEIVFKEENGFKVILTEEEMIRFLESIDSYTGEGLRDRTMFELMYVSGLRFREVLNLMVSDIDFGLNEVLIRQGKGRKDRIVPFGRICREYLFTWVKKIRNWFTGKKDEGYVFLSRSGCRILNSTFNRKFKIYLKRCGINKKGVSLHSIRHSCATHLIQHGADIRYVQELLGHKSIETTVVYTRGIVDNLKKMHKTYHPRENVLYNDDI